MSILRVKDSFMLYGRNGEENRMFRAGDLIDSTEAVVKGHEMFFQPVEEFVERQTKRANTRLRDREQIGKSDDKVVERATADPGEKRSVGRPKVSDEQPTAKPDSKAATKKDGEV